MEHEQEPEITTLKINPTPSQVSFQIHPDKRPPEIQSGTHYARDVETALRNELPSLKSELTWTGIWKAWTRFWCNVVPAQFWLMHMDLLYIPVYRPEWGRYRNWVPDLKPLRPELSQEEQEANAVIQTDTAYEARQLYGVYMTHDWTGCEPITINVSGTVFVTQLRTLKNFPNSLLGNDKKRKRYFNPRRKEYFFDRHARCFEAILHYLQTDGAELNRPMNVPLPVFEGEFKFYQLERAGVDRLLAEEGYVKDTEDSKPKNLLQRKLCLLLDYPYSSYQARIVALLSVLVVILSIALFCMETIQEFLLQKEKEDLRDPFFLVETVCMLWFCFELVIRFGVSVSKLRFIRNPMNIVDIVAIIPYFFQVIAFQIKEQEIQVDQNSDDPDLVMEDEKEAPSLTVLTAVRMIRVLRIFKLSRHSEGLQILVRTLTASVRELSLLAFFLAVGTILFAAALFHAELSATPDQTFDSIPDAFFYVIVTMTTVGYGEKFPVTLIGRLIGSFCALVGVLTLALPVPVIVANFNYFYHRESDEQYEQVQRSKHFVQHCPWRQECEMIRASGSRYFEHDGSNVEGAAKIRSLTGKAEMDTYLDKHQSVMAIDDIIELGPPPKRSKTQANYDVDASRKNSIPRSVGTRRGHD